MNIFTQLRASSHRSWAHY